MRFIVTHPATFQVGAVLKLDKEQAAARASNLVKGKGGRHEVIAPVQFKVGEVVGLDTDAAPKGLEACLDCLDVVKTAEPEVAAADPVTESAIDLAAQEGAAE